MRVIKFKLLHQDSTHQGLELKVSECSYDNHAVHKITLKGYYKLLSNESNHNSFIIKNIQNSEIEFKSDTSELVINSSHFVVFPTKTDFLFAASKVIEDNDNLEIELAFPHA